MLSLVEAQTFSLGVAAIMMGNSISLMMDNAVQNEARGQMISNASAAQCCALIISSGVASVKPG